MGGLRVWAIWGDPGKGLLMTFTLGFTTRLGLLTPAPPGPPNTVTLSYSLQNSISSLSLVGPFRGREAGALSALSSAVCPVPATIRT